MDGIVINESYSIDFGMLILNVLFVGFLVVVFTAFLVTVGYWVVVGNRKIHKRMRSRFIAGRDLRDG